MAEMLFRWGWGRYHAVPLSAEVAVLVQQAIHLTGTYDGRTRCVEVDEIDDAPAHVVKAQTEIQVYGAPRYKNGKIVHWEVTVCAAVMHEYDRSEALLDHDMEVIEHEARVQEEINPDITSDTYNKYVHERWESPALVRI